MRVEVCEFLRTCSFRSWQNLSRFVSHYPRPNSELKCKRRQEKNVFDHTCGVGVLDDVVSVQVGPLGSRLPGVLGRTGRPEGAGAAEVDGGPGLLDPGAEAALDHLLLGLLGLLDLPRGGLFAVSGLGSGLLVGGALRHWLGASLGLCCNVMKEIASDWE